MENKTVYKAEFDADAPKRIEEIHIVWQEDESPDCHVGCYAIAQVSYPVRQGCRRLETLRSGGLWGIESDSGKEYLAEIEQAQLGDLKEHLEQLAGIEWPELDAVTV